MSETMATRIAYGKALAQLGETNKKVVVLDADLAHATMTSTFAEAFPDRFFNAGIAEANMVDMAAGLSITGFIPFTSTIAVFADRAYEQIRNGVCYSKMNVKFGMTHAGITLGEDGGTHQAIEDVAIMRVLPGMTILSPCDANETFKAVQAAAEIDGPVYLRLSRLSTVVFEKEMPFVVGKANVFQEGEDVAIFTYGVMVEECLKVASVLEQKGISTAVINMHTLKPLDEDVIKLYAKRCKRIVTVEEHSVIGGLGDGAASVLATNGIPCVLQKLGVQDRFGQTGNPEDVMAEYGLTAEQIVKDILGAIK